MITLGIETSCDETALALIETRITDGILECRIISSLIHSQAEIHSSYGGVFPALAKREHSKNLLPLLRKLLNESSTDNPSANPTAIPDTKFNEIFESLRTELATQNSDLLQSFTDIDFLKNIPSIDRIAVTEGPGLEPALWVGITFAKIISKLWSIPLIPVNHMEGHIVGSLLNVEVPQGTWQKLKLLPTPAIALLVSGGHTELIKILEDVSSLPSSFKYEILGQTKDDAVGEAFDKTARLLGLSYPGGPQISKLADEARKSGIVSNIKLPRPMLHSHDLNFSFSGLKTAVLYAVRENTDSKNGTLTDEFRKGLAREFEEAVTETLATKLRSAIEEIGAKAIIIGGGVSANTTLRDKFTEIAEEYGFPILLPSQHVSGDNALMIALAGALDGRVHNDNLKAQGTMKLGD